MGLFSEKNNDGTIKMVATHLSGLEDVYEKNRIVYVIWDENNKKLIFKTKIFSKKQTEYIVNLEISKIKRIGIIQEKEVIERSKSVGGRALVGGLLLGPLGMIVGGMSGVGNNKSSKIKMFMVINYDEEKVITLELPLIPLNSNKITLAVRAHLNAPTEINI